MDLAQTIKGLSKILEREPTLDELKSFYDQDLHNKNTYIIYPFTSNAIDALKELIADQVQKRKKRPIRYDEIERYLTVYDLIESGKKMKEVISILAPHQDANNVDVIRSFRRDLAKAKLIISNAEQNEFPGSY